MASNKRSARQSQRKAFEQSLGDMDDVFARERQHQHRAQEQRKVGRRNKTCASKNRYATRSDARDAIFACAEHGRTGLSTYRCPYCNGWHLTSHPQSRA